MDVRVLIPYLLLEMFCVVVMFAWVKLRLSVSFLVWFVVLFTLQHFCAGPLRLWYLGGLQRLSRVDSPALLYGCGVLCLLAGLAKGVDRRCLLLAAICCIAI